ncbi:MAG: DUF2357 domain-containing protein [Planctomycetaceae bacterium]|nr:DUF2357 domain-containing protein [Planctomycetaceae bacterium]
MVASKQELYVGAFPWLAPGDRCVATTSVEMCRGFITLPFSTSSVICDECKDPLPLVAQWTDTNRTTWAKYELPRGETQIARSRVYYSDPRVAGQASSEIPLCSGISRSKLDEDLEIEDELSPQYEHFARLRDHIDNHTEFINDLYDQVKPNRYYWEGNHGGHAIRSVFRTSLRWLKSDDRDHARLALIVKLAREISRTLQQVCEAPRVVLRRSREFQKIAKIQEIDPACLRWLARQPGRDVYERAGSRQQLLGIVRKEDTDTLENRVVKDLLHRARVECANYISIYRDYQNQERVRLVQKFRRQIIHWEKTSEIAAAKRLTGPVQPNYVLLHENKYRKLWDAYQLLLSQQKQKDDIWKWRDRTFSESCEVGLLSLLAKYTRRSTFCRSDIAIRMESLNGRYISAETEIGSGVVKDAHSNTELTFVRGGITALKCQYIPVDLLSLAADFYILNSGSTNNRVIPVWCLSEVEEKKLSDAIEILEFKLSASRARASTFPLILVFHNSQAERYFWGQRGLIASLEFPMPKSMRKLEAFIFSILGIA